VTIVLFACVQNAGRSQMAAAFFNAFADPSTARAISAGTAPASQVHPEVIAAMREVGIELGGAAPRLLTRALAEQAHLLVTMGCGESCPFVPGLRREDWSLEDPKGKPVESVRAIREEIRRRVEQLVEAEVARSDR
jgi:arsenate reductase